MMNLKKWIVVFCSVMLSATSLVSAATWTGGAGTDNWIDGANWDTTVAPDEGEPVIIQDAEVDYDYSSNFDRSADTTLSGDAVLTIGPDRRFRNAYHGSSTLTIADNAVMNHAGKYLWVGNGAAGTISQTGGVVNSTVYGNMFITENSASSGSVYHLTGGVLNLHLAANASTSDWYNQLIGKGGGSGMIWVDGGEANFTVDPTVTVRSIYIINESTLQIDSGTASFSGFRLFAVGHHDDGTDLDGEARLIVNGGTLDISTLDDGMTAIGGDGQKGRAEINGGVFNVHGIGGLCVGQGHRGAFEQAGGSIVVDNDVTLGDSATAAGSYYRMSGGTLSANDIVCGESGDVRFIFTGGRITLNGDRLALLSEPWFEAAAGTLVEYDSINGVTTISRLPYAHDPAPVNGQTDVGQPVAAGKVEVTLGWKTGLSVETATAGQVNADIVKHLVYLSDPSSGDPNFILVDEIAAGTPVAESASYGPIVLDMDHHYFWRVDEQTNEPNIVTGPVWTFSTPRAVPEIEGIASSGRYDEGEAAQITVTYASGATDVTDVKWYLDGDLLNPGIDANLSVSYSNTESTLTIASMQDGYEGAYYCVVTNGGGDSQPSGTVDLALRKMLSWYKFENGIEDTISGSAGLIVNGPLDYAGGIVASDGQAYAVDPNGGNYIELTTESYPKAGYGNGLDEFTYSCWVRMPAITETVMIMGCANALPDDADRHRTALEFGVTDKGKVKFALRDESSNYLSFYSAEEGLLDNAWHCIAATSDGDTLVLYVDGEAVASSDLSSISDFGPWDHPMTVLADNYRGEVKAYFQGLMDDLRIYNYAFTAEEIAMMNYNETGHSACLNAPDERFNVVNTGSSYCRIDLQDFAVFVGSWMECGLYPECN